MSNVSGCNTGSGAPEGVKFLENWFATWGAEARMAPELMRGQAQVMEEAQALACYLLQPPATS